MWIKKQKNAARIILKSEQGVFGNEFLPASERYVLLHLQTLKAPASQPTCSACICSVGSSFLGESEGGNIKGRKLIMVDWEQGTSKDLNVSNS